MNFLLLAGVVFAWGFSWYAITLQIGEASALVALSYRFLLAAFVMCVGLVLTGRWRPIPWRHQKWLAVMGFCIFSMNFLCFYLAAYYLPSGLLSVIFSTAAIFGAVNAWIFFRKPIEGRVILAAVLGIAGLAMLLLPEMDSGATRRAPLWAFLLPFLGTFFFSLGNIASARLSERYELPNIVGQGMIWGALWLVAASVIAGESFTIPRSIPFWGGVVYLALIASLLAFLTYLSLVNRVGPARASYATVLFPILAMIVSTYAEGYEWTTLSFVGLALALGGTVVSFAQKG